MSHSVRDGKEITRRRTPVNDCQYCSGNCSGSVPRRIDLSEYRKRAALLSNHYQLRSMCPNDTFGLGVSCFYQLS